MNGSRESAYQAELMRFAREADWFMRALRAARALGLSSWCIGAGAVRTLVWDRLHGYPSPSQLTDIDVVYFDAAVLAAERDAELQAYLAAALPAYSWEITNQAAVHQWFEGYFGHSVPPLASLDEAVASWPEYATAVGLVLQADDSLRIIAPYGLEDLFAMRIRRNPLRVSVETYRQRVAQKRYTEHWPGVTVVPC